MKILFIGLGSIGQRHASILQKNFKHQLFAWRSGINPKPNSLGIPEAHSLQEAIKLQPDIVFITNPTSLHIATALYFAKLSCQLFIEKPIGKDTKNLDKLLKIVKDKNLTTYIAYNLRFHPVITWLKKYSKGKKPLHVRAVCSSYLPNWKPGTKFLESYSANSNLGGGVLLDLSHELDYISYLFGPIKDIKANFAKASKVTKDAEDFADLLAETHFLSTNIHIDFLSQRTERYIQIEFENQTILADIIKAQITMYSQNKTITYQLDYQKGQEYVLQMQYFLRNINNSKMMNNLEEASILYRQIIKMKQKHS